MHYILKYLFPITLCCIIASCGCSGNKKKSSTNEKTEGEKQVEMVEENDSKQGIDSSAQSPSSDGEKRYRKPTERKQRESKLKRRSTAGKPIPVPENETVRSKTTDKAKIDKRVNLSKRMMQADRDRDSALYDKLKQEADELTKTMSIDEQNEAYKQIKDIKKRF